jgi:hypothetical protein
MAAKEGECPGTAKPQTKELNRGFRGFHGLGLDGHAVARFHSGLNLPARRAKHKCGIARNRPLYAEVSDRSQPPLAFDLSQAEPAGPGSLHRLVGLSERS